jgi:hypothetical protein
VSGTAELFLGIIALSVLVMAAIQVGVLVLGLRLAKRTEELSRQIDREIRPILANLTELSAEAARTAQLASSQVERVDRVFSELTHRVDQTLAVAQHFVQGPAKNGMALVTGVRAAVSAFQGIREASRRRRKTSPGVEDDSLFIG